MTEVWKRSPSYPMYDVSSHNRVRRNCRGPGTYRGRVLTPGRAHGGQVETVEVRNRGDVRGQRIPVADLHREAFVDGYPTILRGAPLPLPDAAEAPQSPLREIAPASIHLPGPGFTWLVSLRDGRICAELSADQ